MMLAKLGAIDAAQSTEYLTAILNGFKLEAGDSVGVVDALIAVDNKAATSAAELSQAISRTANIAAESGVSMNKLIGYIATVSSVTRKSASTIGESFKTIFSRMESVKLGKLIDDTGESLSDVETSLSRIGIKLRSDDTTFRNMGDVLDDIAAKWGQLNDVDRQAIAQSVAGKKPTARTYSNIWGTI